ncbi:MAG: DUF424 family protein [Nanoarchaeota archaeon]|nr:DUF424 family protein [Nanoarchaeota archaeon]MBU1632165.1 DUF424 family protein [Nanoarchaeota archaeon]MBU1876308.1 DUF424 family protein [Nanoarchaeota archaeon]
MNFIVAQRDSENGLLLIVTDSEIIGKFFEEEKVQLDLSKKFYEGEEKSKEDVKKLIAKAKHIHLTGKEAVAIGVELDIIDSDRILFVKGVPHAEATLE